jgi:hypothetical protein
MATLPEGKLPPGWMYNIASVDEAPEGHWSILLLAGLNLPKVEIASRLGVTVDLVRRVLRHGPYREYISRHRSAIFAKQVEAHQVLHDAQTEVAQALLDLIRNGKEATRLSAIKLYHTTLGLGTLGACVEDERVEDSDRTPASLDLNALEKIRASVGG